MRYFSRLSSGTSRAFIAWSMVQFIFFISFLMESVSLSSIPSSINIYPSLVILITSLISSNSALSKNLSASVYNIAVVFSALSSILGFARRIASVTCSRHLNLTDFEVGASCSIALQDKAKTGYPHVSRGSFFIRLWIFSVLLCTFFIYSFSFFQNIDRRIHIPVHPVSTFA